MKDNIEYFYVVENPAPLDLSWGIVKSAHETEERANDAKKPGDIIVRSNTPYLPGQTIDSIAPRQ